MIPPPQKKNQKPHPEKFSSSGKFSAENPYVDLTCKLPFDEQVNIGQVKAGMVQGQLTGQALEKAYSILDA
jgi:hypothetical protein